MADNDRQKHHYVPQCYLKRWAGADAMLCEYQRFQQRIVPRRVHPAQTGWAHKLYWVSDLAEPDRDAIERVFFSRVDQGASDALDRLDNCRELDTPKLRTGWSRFLMSLMQRHPGKVEEMWARAKAEYGDHIDEHRAAYEKMKDPEDLATFEEFRDTNAKTHVAVLFAKVLRMACDSENVGQHLNGMQCTVIRLEGRTRLLTSDNPLIINTGLAYDHCRIMLPIGPRRLFVAANRPEVIYDTLHKMRTTDFVHRINAQVVNQTFRFAYAICRNQLGLMERDWPRQRPATYAHLRPPPEGYYPAAAE